MILALELTVVEQSEAIPIFAKALAWIVLVMV